MEDIADILADVSRDPQDPFAEYDALYDSTGRGGAHSGQLDLQALTRAWVNERGTSELLRYLLSISFTRQYYLQDTADGLKTASSIVSPLSSKYRYPKLRR